MKQGKKPTIPTSRCNTNIYNKVMERTKTTQTEDKSQQASVK